SQYRRPVVVLEVTEYLHRLGHYPFGPVFELCRRIVALAQSHVREAASDNRGWCGSVGIISLDNAQGGVMLTEQAVDVFVVPGLVTELYCQHPVLGVPGQEIVEDLQVHSEVWRKLDQYRAHLLRKGDCRFSEASHLGFSILEPLYMSDSLAELESESKPFRHL